MDDGQSNAMNFTTSKEVSAFFAKDYPLIKLFRYGNDILLYDAKPHCAFIISNPELEVLTEFLAGKPASEMEEIHAATLGHDFIRQLIAKYRELQSCGVFIKGLVDEISSGERDVLKKQLTYFDENIVLRKFCLEVTEDCNYRCTYCKNTIATENRRHSKTYLSAENAFKGIDYYFHKYVTIFAKLGEAKKVLLLEIAPPSLSWYGGEPFLNFDLVKKSAAYFKDLPWDKYGIGRNNIRFSINTNLSIIDDEILNFLVDHKVHLYASLDGPQEEHDKCRVFGNGTGTFAKAYHNLQKIKEYNEIYFKEKVTIFGVYTTKHDYHKCLDFICNLGACDFRQFPAAYSGVFVPNIESETREYHRALSNNLADFKNNVRAKLPDFDKHIDYFSNLLKFGDLKDDNPVGYNFLKTLITCPMGFDNLMVAANGNYLICHKTDGSMPIGDCMSGLDFEKITDLYQRYNRNINNPECRNCWNVRFCKACAAMRMNSNRFFNPTQKECDFFRLQTTYDFLCFSYLSIEHPELLEKILVYKNDRTRYISHIDVNEL
ncbi:MAG TPA: hypothetical protein DDW65_10640 [Firmicutes bacterium]|jgi:uncharacterized protein|nr:hypothetical protein [Bacillota bacterium]